MPKIIIQIFVLDLIFIVCTCAYGCIPDSVNEGSCTEILNAISEQRTGNSKNVLLVIADDRSGSMTAGTQPVRLDKEVYSGLLQEFVNKKISGSLLVRVIGNPSHSGFIRHNFKPYFDTIPSCPNPTLKELGRLKRANKSISEKNEQIASENKSKLAAFINEKIVPYVINYEPGPGGDQTDLHTAFRDIEYEVNSYEFKEYDKIIVALVSDGVHEYGVIENPNITLNLKPACELILIGWREEDTVGMKQVIRRSDGNALLSSFKAMEIN